MPEKFARLNIHEAQNVIIAQHIRVLDADRCQLTFGSFGVDFDTSRNSAPGGAREELNGESAARSVKFSLAALLSSNVWLGEVFKNQVWIYETCNSYTPIISKSSCTSGLFGFNHYLVHVHD